MPHRQLLREIESGKFRPVYLLHGEEPFFSDVVAEALERHVVEESMRDFNLTVVYGREATVDQVLEAARRFPMMAERQLVVVREAQDWPAWRRSEDMARLEAYVESPASGTVLVFNFRGKKADGRLKAVKAIAARGIVFLSEKVRESKLPEWIVGHVQSAGLRIGGPASVVLADALGTDLQKIANEVAKLRIVLPAGAEVTPEVIEEHIGISKEFNVFELQNALASKDIGRASRIVNYFEANPKDHPVAMVAPVLASFFAKLYIYHGLKDKSQGPAAAAMGCPPFAVRSFAEAARHYPVAKVGRIFGYLREADRKSKGQGNATVEDGMLLREAVFKILH